VASQIPITAILFDFGQVIASFDLERMVRNLADASGSAPAAIRGHMMEVRDLAIRYESGSLTSDAFFEQVRTKTGMRLDRDGFRKAYCDIFTPIPGTHDIIRVLKPRYRLALVSNTSEWHFEYGIRTVDVFPLFDTVTLSYEVGAMKPDPAVYHDALRKLGLPPAACIYVDDIQINVEAAAQLGMRAFRYVDNATLLRDLASAGVAVTPTDSGRPA
jgi:epoxide hydrolase-like predicted phosphatase